MKRNLIFVAVMALCLALSLWAVIKVSQPPQFSYAPSLLNEVARGNGSITGDLIGSSTSLTLTAGQVITPAYTLYNLSAGGAVSMTLGATCSSGQLLYLHGDDNQTITVNDDNIYTTDGNAVTLGQYDLVGWLCWNNKWHHLFKSANS